MRIAIVGNAPETGDIGAIVDAADRVVRFNNAHGFGGVSGHRVDDLWLVNCGGQPLKWLTTPGFWDRPAIQATPHVTLPHAGGDRPVLPLTSPPAPETLDGLNFAADMRVALTVSGKAETVLDPTVLDRARDLLRDPAHPAAVVTPSTGFLAILDYAERLPEAQIDLYGFRFGGWDGHSWDRERAWVEQAEASGRLRWWRVQRERDSTAR